MSRSPKSEIMIIGDEQKLGFSVVGNDQRFINAKIDHILNFIDRLQLAEVVRSKFEITVLSDLTGSAEMETGKYDDF